MFRSVSKFSKTLAWLLAMSQVVLPAHAAISNLPPMVKAGVSPNVFFTLDDSGSMMFEILPEDVGPVGNASDRITVDGKTWTRDSVSSNYCNPDVSSCWVIHMFPQPQNVYNVNGNGNYSGRSASVVGFNDNITVARLRSSVVNSAYYDPAIRYVPWTNPDSISITNPYGTPMANANPAAAKWNPVAPTGGNNTPSLRLDQDYPVTGTYASASWLNDQAYDVKTESRTFYPATYYVYQPRATYKPGVDPVCSTSVLKCFTRIEIRPGVPLGAKGTGRSDCASTTCTYNEELQNFANWFQYYRSRINIARAGVGQAFAKQGAGMRVGFGTINYPGTKIQGVGTDFAPAAKSSFLNTYYSQVIPKAGTPLRKAMDEVGQYFMDQSKNGPWENVPGNSGTSVQTTCRQNFNILMTDGYWNGTGASSPRNTNVDGSTSTSSMNKFFTYTPSKPYMDGEPDTLADVAMYYWVTDLRPDWNDVKKKNVPVSKDGVDTAFWQHLVQYTVGLGVKGSLDSTKDLPALSSTGSNSKTWPTAADNQVDDLWHAAVNSRGKFFSAANPTQFADALNSALNEISARAGDAAAVATSNTILGANTKVYTSTYMTGDWSGRLEQKTLDPVTGNIKSTDWNTDTTIPAAAARKIVSSGSGGTGGIDFIYDQLSAAHKQVFDTAAALYPTPNIVNGTQLLDYIRGDKTKEGQPFRSRKLLLGDLVNSDPQYIKEGRNAGYGNLPVGSVGQSSYIDYYNGNLKNRSATVYVGSNDGMLHAFNASEDSNKGKERFAFVPQEVIANLPELAKPNYVHKFYADATPMIADAALGTGTTPWRTVLVSGLGAGGRSFFALDVTDPTVFDKSKVMWERSASFPTVDNDLGYTFGVPQVGRLRDGRWVAIAGNGYESASGKAVLYILNLATGAILYKLDTGVGNTTTRNGLSTPKILYNSDSTINSVFAGDLQGNIWKFNFVDSTTLPIVTTPQVGIGGTPLYRSNRPITSQPQLYPHPQGGFMVLFGNGKIYEDTDPTTTTEESLYGIWDKGTNTQVTASQLVTQTLSFVDTIYYGVTSNTIDWATKRGWVIPMKLKAGERLITDPNVFENQVIFTTIVPNTSSDPCALDGLTTTLQINPLNGGPLGYPILDTNGDGQVNRSDKMVSGKQTSSTFGTTIVKIGDGNWKVFQVPSGGAGGTPGLTNGDLRKGMDSIPTVRLWRQILNAQ
jgi:type IV pilus assembly protein PilY1